MSVARHPRPAPLPEAEVDEIARFIARDNLDAAKRFYDAVRSVSETDLSAIPLCFWVLGTHVALGLFLAYAGCRHSRWE